MEYKRSFHFVKYLNQSRVIRQNLKGHCHAICQLKKKQEGVFASIEFQN